MVVQYIYTLKSLTKENARNEILTLRDTIKDRGHSIPIDDLDKQLAAIPILSDVEAESTSKKYSNYDYDSYTFAISESDAIIHEGSLHNSIIGLSIGIALSMGKPYLILENKLTKPEESSTSSFKHLNHPLLTYKEYSTLEELQQIVLDFLESINHRVRVRFNLVMDQNHDNYLTWAASQYDTTKTEMITRSITEQAKRDTLYQSQRKQFLKLKETTDPECV